MTKFGIVTEDGDLGNLDRHQFLLWTKQYKQNNEVVPQTEEQWVLTYKQTLAADYTSKAFRITEK